MIIEADDVEHARKQVGRLPFVSNGLLFFDFEPVGKVALRERLRPKWHQRTVSN